MKSNRRFGTKKISLAFSLVALVFLVMVLSVASAALLAFLLKRAGLIDLNQPDSYRGIYVLLYISVFMGVVIAALLSRRSVKPIRDMMEATDRVAKGDFSAQATVKGSVVFELDKLAASFNKMVRELQGIETLRSDFVRNFSHEFKTPIVSISGFAKLLKQGNLSEADRQDYLDRIIQESERLVELSASILNLSKVENTEILREKTVFRLDEQIRLAMLMLEPKWSAKALKLDIALVKVDIVGNKNLLQQVWLNLLDNAIKFTDEGGTLRIALWRDGREAVFRLEDSGCGMSEETMRRMFDKFYQGDPSRSKTGNGLGLAIVKRIVDLSEGTIEADSRLGQGSVFTVRLPLGTG
ncbi:Integral membrane sensor signal transduction histidine kinase [Thermobacillus xylanilyticus]|uniref:histidine kinase n=1 Tax=Thermobacillus xylanilyticus TaxID=76633 RepID=A0ABM8V7R0_THEXY|nr:HAMP domain-containing sensor histidine kinase [Thermobacillus xylanilyticus]CAG5091730.1 Integral membrane sensor signal transduction histidine kinase [Thermobacillus xylanilyticus]